MASRLDFYKLKTPVFEGMGIEDEIAKLLRPKVWLKSGAYLIIEKTEAMVVVDVNQQAKERANKLLERMLVK